MFFLLLLYYRARTSKNSEQKRRADILKQSDTWGLLQFNFTVWNLNLFFIDKQVSLLKTLFSLEVFKFEIIDVKMRGNFCKE